MIEKHKLYVIRQYTSEVEESREHQARRRRFSSRAEGSGDNDVQIALLSTGHTPLFSASATAYTISEKAHFPSREDMNLY